MASATISGLGGGVDTSLEPLEFSAAVPSGPILLGEPGTLVITVDNPHGHRVVIEDVDIEVLQPSNPGCRPEWLQVDDFRADRQAVTVPSEGTARFTVGFVLVDLPDINQDACQGSDFPLAIAGAGVPVP